MYKKSIRIQDVYSVLVILGIRGWMGTYYIFIRSHIYNLVLLLKGFSGSFLGHNILD